MARTVAICNQKGGVGKTTTAINLSAAFALSGIKTLLIDLDPQANATGGLGVDKRALTQSIYQVLLDGVSIESVIIPTPVSNLWLVPSQVGLSGAEVELVTLPQRESRLTQALEPIRTPFEAIFIDSPPSLGLLTVNALAAAQRVLIPLQCEYYALEGLSQLLDTIRLVKENLNPQLQIEGILLTMADFRTKLTLDVIQEARRFFGSQVLDPVVPRSVRLSEAPSRGLPIALYDPTSSGSLAYQQLADTLKSRWGKEKSDVADAWIGQRDPGPDSGVRFGPEEGGSHPDSTQGDPPKWIPTSTESG